METDMGAWLLKTEPDSFSIADLEAKASKGEMWDGVRNFQARNLIRDRIRCGDRVLVYHSRCRQVGVVGEAVVTRAAYPCPFQYDRTSPYFDEKSTADNPRWFVFDVQHVATFPRCLTLASLKAQPELAQMVLFKQRRLSVVPLTMFELEFVLSLSR